MVAPDSSSASETSEPPSPGESMNVIGDLVRLVFSQNSGALFGLFRDNALIFGIVRVVIGIIGGILGFILAPVGLLVLALFVIGGVIVGLLSLLAPLVPIALLALLVWAIYRITQRRPTPTF